MNINVERGCICEGVGGCVCEGAEGWGCEGVVEEFGVKVLLSCEGNVVLIEQGLKIVDIEMIMHVIDLYIIYC